MVDSMIVGILDHFASEDPVDRNDSEDLEEKFKRKTCSETRVP